MRLKNLKKTVIALLLLISCTVAGQNNTPIPSSIYADTCIDKKFSLVFYVVLDSLYTPIPATQPTIAAVVARLNEVFKPICVSFENCTTIYIPNYIFNIWSKPTTEALVTANWYTEKTINIYIADSTKLTAGEVFGYAYGPSILPNPMSVPTRSDIIVLEKNYLTDFNFWSACHHMGHFFGLPHTFAEISPNTSTVTPQPDPTIESHEFVDGSNCAQHGDGFCDTEADPNSNSIFTDGKGHFYMPPSDNYMAFYLTGCKFTAQQYGFMARTIVRKRLYLH